MKRKIRRFAFLLCIIIHFLPLCAEAKESAIPKTNVFVYMIGSDLESVDAQGTADLREMLSGMRSAPDELRLFLYGGGSTAWDNRYFTAGENSCYLVSREGTSRLFPNEKKNMARGETLTAFLRSAGEYYPAERNVLILWSHGNGALGGFGLESNYPDEASMSLPTLAEALAAASLRFELIVFDACLMSTVETAQALSPYGEYLLAPACLDSDMGLNYDEFFTALGNITAGSLESFGVYISEQYMAACEAACPARSVGLTLTDLEAFSRSLPRALDALAEELHGKLRCGGYAPIARARMNAPELGSGIQSDAVDLYGFCELLDTDKAKAVTEALEECVIFSEYRNLPRLGGLSLMLPFHSLSDTDKYLQLCEALGFCEKYRDFVCLFNGVELCGQIAQGDGMSFLRYLLNGKSKESNILFPAEIKASVLAALDGTAPLSAQSLNGGNIGFLRTAFAEEKTLNMACRYASANSFRPSRIRRISFNRSRKTVLGFSTQEKLVGRLYREIQTENQGSVFSLGWMPLEKRDGVWRSPAEDWYSVDEHVCVVYSLNSFESKAGTVTTALIPAEINGVSGYLTALLSREEGSTITGFMVGYTRENYGLWGKVLSVGSFRPSDTVKLHTALISREDDQCEERELSLPLSAGDALKLRETALPEEGKYRVVYRVCDIYDRYHILSED